MGEMKLLLDTHIFLWWISGSMQLSPNATAALRDPLNERYLSSVSVAEIAVQTSLGKLMLADTPENTVRNGIAQLRVLELSLLIRHPLMLARLSHFRTLNPVLAAENALSTP